MLNDGIREVYRGFVGKVKAGNKNRNMCVTKDTAKIGLLDNVLLEKPELGKVVRFRVNATTIRRRKAR